MNPLTAAISGCSCGCHASGTNFVGPASWLSPEQVVDYVRGAVTLGTLRNYRSARIGPRYLKVGRSIFYNVEAVNDWLAELALEDERRWKDQM